MQELPKFHETFIPILSVLENQQRALAKKEITLEVRNKFYSQLPLELHSQKISTGENTLLNRIGWGLSYLVLAGYAYRPSRGNYEITREGKEVLQKGTLTLRELKQQPEFISRTKKVLNKSQDTNNGKESLTSEDETPSDSIDAAVKEIEEFVKLELLEKLKQINPYDFEKVILDLLHAMGYGETVRTPKSHDGGIDGVVNEDKLGLEKIYIQAKRFNDTKVREKEIRNFIGAMSGDTNKGIFVTTSDFDEKAEAKARAAHHTIKLINGDELVKLMYDYGVGVQVKKTIEIKKFDSDFFEE